MSNLAHRLRRKANVGPLSLTYVSSATSGADATVYDFGNFNAPFNGLLIVGVQGHAGSSRSISSVSIEGVNGTIAGQFGGALWTPIGFATRAILAGNNNVTVTFSAGMTRASVAVWLLRNYGSATPHDIDGSDAGSGGTSHSVTIDIPENGVATYMHAHSNSNDTSWSSATERMDTTVDGARVSAADKVVTSALSGHVETASWSGSAGRQVTGASWS